MRILNPNKDFDNFIIACKKGKKFVLSNDIVKKILALDERALLPVWDNCISAFIAEEYAGVFLEYSNKKSRLLLLFVDAEIASNIITTEGKKDF